MFTAANTSPANSAGEGASTISGRKITAIACNLNATNNSHVD